MKESNITFVKSVLLLLLLFLVGREIQAQSRFSPCSKLDYELYAPILNELYNPLAAEQYIVAEGESEKYALQVIDGSRLSERTYILAYMDLKGNKKELTDSLCQMKIASCCVMQCCLLHPLYVGSLGYDKRHVSSLTCKMEQNTLSVRKKNMVGED